MNKKKLKGLPPVVDCRSRILILGSFPGTMSLAKREYYAYPRNQFWRIMFDILGHRQLTGYCARLKALKDHHIALWDVISSCHRSSASDSNISEPIFNDIAKLLRHYPRIKAIFCNGNKSYSVCKSRLCGTVLPVAYLPSTSPAHAGLTYARKKRTWRRLLKEL